MSTFFHNIGSFLSLGDRRWSRNNDATTQGSCSPVILLALIAFSSRTSQAYHIKRDQQIRESTQLAKNKTSDLHIMQLGMNRLFFLNLSVLLLFLKKKNFFPLKHSKSLSKEFPLCHKFILLLCSWRLLDQLPYKTQKDHSTIWGLTIWTRVNHEPAQNLGILGDQEWMPPGLKLKETKLKDLNLIL